MRLALIIDSSFKSRLSPSFCPISHASCITVSQERTSGIWACKRNFQVLNKRIAIGAVSWPYAQTDHKTVGQEIPAFKSGRMMFKYAINAAGVMVAVRYNKDTGWDEDSAGNRYDKRDCKYAYFDSSILNEAKAQRAQGEPIKISEDYFTWLQNSASQNQMIDAAHPVGKLMVRAITELFFAQISPERVLRFPEFYIRSNAALPFADNAIDGLILEAGRSPESRLSCERPPFDCVVTGWTRTKLDGEDFESLAVDIRRVTQDSNGNWVLCGTETNDIQTVMFPDPNGVITMCKALPDYSEKAYPIGKQVEPEYVVSRLRSLVRLIPCSLTWANVKAIRNRIGDPLMEYVTTGVASQNIVTIGGVKAYSLSLLTEIPANTRTEDVFIPCAPWAVVLELPREAFRGEHGQHIVFDLVNSPKTKPGVDNIPAPRTFLPRKERPFGTSSLGSLMQAAQAASKEKAQAERPREEAAVKVPAPSEEAPPVQPAPAA